MAVFVIVIMIAFVIPQLLRQLARPKFTPGKTVYWTYDDGKKITAVDIKAAANELAILRGLYAERILLSQRDMGMLLLSHMLFPASIPAASFSDQIKQMVMRNNIPVSNRRIDDFFSQTKGQSKLWWILLRAEARRSGCAVSTDAAGALLSRAIPKITNGSVKAATLVRRLSTAYHATENQILRTFADLLLVTTYSRTITESEDITEQQLMNDASDMFGSIDANCVVFNADSFVKSSAEPTQTQITAQFARYKDNYPYRVSEDNPYGFGYKLSARVQLEYMITRLSDVRKLITPPTEEQLEQYYQANHERFTEKVKKNPADPNSKMVSRQKSYAEVAESIRETILNGEINTKAAAIINEAVAAADANLADIDVSTAVTEQLKAGAGSFAQAAAKVGSKYGIDVRVGRTGLVSAREIQQNPLLGRLAMSGQSRMPSSLVRMVFSIDELGVTRLGAYEAPKPRLYLSISPMFTASGAGKIAAAVRIVNYALPQAPPDVDYKYQKNLPQADPNATVDNVYSVKKIVAEDLKRIEAMKTADQKAKDFMAAAGPGGDWKKAAIAMETSLIKDYPGVSLSVRSLSLTRENMAQSQVRSVDTLTPEMYMSQVDTYNRLVALFAGQFRPGEEKPKSLPLIIEYKPYFAYYCVEDMTRKYAGMDDYEKMRPTIAYKEDFLNAQAMAFEHYMPVNIKKRMNVQKSEQSKEQEPKTPADMNQSHRQ